MSSSFPVRNCARAAVTLVLMVGGFPMACAHAPSIEALQHTRAAVAELDDWGALLLRAGIPITALPTEDLLTLEEVKRLRLMLSLPTKMEHYEPRDGALRAGPYEVGVWYREGDNGIPQRVVELPAEAP